MSLTAALILALVAGLSIPLGAAIASIRFAEFCCHNEVDSLVSYFGGGALVAAITLVLIPEGREHLSIPETALSFLAGGVVFWQSSAFLARSDSFASHLIGMMLNFVPEAILLGVENATATEHHRQAGQLVVIGKNLISERGKQRTRQRYERKYDPKSQKRDSVDFHFAKRSESFRHVLQRD